MAADRTAARNTEAAPGGGGRRFGEAVTAEEGDAVTRRMWCWGVGPAGASDVHARSGQRRRPSVEPNRPCSIRRRRNTRVWTSRIPQRCSRTGRPVIQAVRFAASVASSPRVCSSRYVACSPAAGMRTSARRPIRFLVRGREPDAAASRAPGPREDPELRGEGSPRERRARPWPSMDHVPTTAASAFPTLPNGKRPERSQLWRPALLSCPDPEVPCVSVLPEIASLLSTDQTPRQRGGTDPSSGRRLGAA
jgi:hypothetical protein